jgi:hypothetical protein
MIHKDHSKKLKTPLVNVPKAQINHIITTTFLFTNMLIPVF